MSLKSLHPLEISVTDAAPRIEAGEVSVVDVREHSEREAGTIADSQTLPLSEGIDTVCDRLAALAQSGVIVCASGVRSLNVAKALEARGMRGWLSLAGGMVAWTGAGAPIATPDGLDASQLDRYSRQLRLPELGVSGQMRLLESRVLVIGAGGLGSPVILYLAAAGVGVLGVADDDRVEISNLHRQVVHDTPSIGEPKTSSASRRASAINPDVQVIEVSERVTADSVTALFAGQWDVVVDCSDSLKTRYVVNDAAWDHGIPVVHGAVHRYDGQVTVFSPPEGPCYRCLYPEQPAGALVPNCSEIGVLGVIPGIVGSIQAAEVLKLLLGVGRSLVGRLMIHDVLEPRVDIITMAAREDCRCRQSVQ